MTDPFVGQAFQPDANRQITSMVHRVSLERLTYFGFETTFNPLRASVGWMTNGNNDEVLLVGVCFSTDESLAVNSSLVLREPWSSD